MNFQFLAKTFQAKEKKIKILTDFYTLNVTEFEDFQIECKEILNKISKNGCTCNLNSQHKTGYNMWTCNATAFCLVSADDWGKGVGGGVGDTNCCENLVYTLH